MVLDKDREATLWSEYVETKDATDIIAHYRPYATVMARNAVRGQVRWDASKTGVFYQLRAIAFSRRGGRITIYSLVICIPLFCSIKCVPYTRNSDQYEPWNWI